MRAVEYLGVEGGGTRTVAVVTDEAGRILRRGEFGPGNARLLSGKEMGNLFRKIARFCPTPAAIGAGLAGVREESDRAKVARAIRGVWGAVPAVVTHDLAIALALADASADAVGKVLVLSGTGSCCYGESARRVAKVGGWGHLLGDVGSGYAIAHEALREAVFHFDRHGKWTTLGRKFLGALVLNTPNDLIAWIHGASKAEVAALARYVFESRTDPVARRIARQAAESLANDAVICARQLARPGRPMMFVLAGGVLLKQPAFAKQVRTRIQRDWPGAKVSALNREGAWGAARMACKEASCARLSTPPSVAEGHPVEVEVTRPAPSEFQSAKVSSPRPLHAARGQRRAAQTTGIYVPDFVPGDSPTEQRNEESMRFHELSTAKMVEIMLNAERKVIPALRKERAAIMRAVEMAAETLKRGGRIFYVGAGTSGRLGVLDASECPPTFRASPEMIQGIIAGGQRALWQAVEGAEDDAEAGASALRFRDLRARDLLIGIAASGRTPFVWGAIGQARRIRARTILVCFNPSLRIERAHRPDLVIAPNLGPEILTGSTRLKSGTATKLVLNMISTIAMVRVGKVISNLMVDLNPSNVKLRDRAVRIVRELTGCSAEEARAALEKNGWVVKRAWAGLRTRVG